VEDAGVSFAQLRRLIITHQDWDHIGGIPDVLRATGGKAEVFAHAAEKPFIDGTLRPIKLTPERIAARLQMLPEHLRAEAAAAFANIPRIPVGQTLQDKDVLPFHGGIEVIHTPGHTPGHICLFLREERLLIAGDALRVENATLVGPAAEHTFDMPTALQSLRKLSAYDIDRVVCYHGGVYGPDASIRIAELVSGRGS